MRTALATVVQVVAVFGLIGRVLWALSVRIVLRNYFISEANRQRD